MFTPESLPTLIEIRTYRFRGHSMSDAGLYRTKEEVEESKKRDPVTIGREYLVRAGVPDKDISEIEEKVRAEIDDAVQFADDSPELAFERLAEFTYKE